jgi:5-methylcytosine-specific restriction endonuclease McrA
VTTATVQVPDVFVSPFGDTAWSELSPEQKKEWRRAYGQWHYQQNRARYAAQAAANYRANPGPAKARARAHNATRDPDAERMRKRESADRHRDATRERIRARRATPEGRAARADEEAMQRALRHGVPRERVRRLLVWARDEGWCYLCGYACDPNDWHLDHVVPHTDGGSHTYDNVAVTHPACNRAKGGKVL